MVANSTFIEKLMELKEKDRIEVQIIEILNHYMRDFPVENAYFFSYSPLTQIAEGIFTIEKSTGLQFSNEIRDDIRTLPPIHSAIQERKAILIRGNDLYRNLGLKYVVNSNINAILVVPVYIGTVVIGYICSTKIKENAIMNEEILESLTNFGFHIGQILNTNNLKSNTILSKRELETMRRVSWGETTKEIASRMHISEATVNQYVKSSIKKLGANNRTHAVALLFRKRMI